MNLNDLLASVVVAGLGYVLVLARQWLVAHTKPGQLAAVAGMARSVVEAIDQLDKAQNLGNDNRLDMAVDTLGDLAKRAGIKLSTKELSAFVHAAVKAVRDEQQYLAPLP